MTPTEIIAFVQILGTLYTSIESRVQVIGYSTIDEYIDYILEDGKIKLNKLDSETEILTRELFDEIKNNLPYSIGDTVQSIANEEWESVVVNTPDALIMKNIYSFLVKSQILDRYS